MKVQKPPRVLVLNMKRFSFGSSFGKINKHTKFEEQLDLPVEDVDGISSQIKYLLQGIVVHHGSSVHSGHYVAYVKVTKLMINIV